MALLARACAALTLGASMVLGFAPFNYWWVYALALCLFIRLLQYQRPLAATALGLALGLGLFGVGTSWVYVSINNFSPASSATAAGVSLLLALYQALFIALACWIYSSLSHRYLKKSAHHQPLIPNLILFSSLWLLAEIPRSHLLNGFPWLLTGYAFFDTTLPGWGKLGGVSATGAAAMLLITCLYFVLQRAPLLAMTAVRMRSLLALVAVGLIVVAGGALRDTLRWRPLSQQEHSFALIQGNIPQEQKWDRTRRQAIVEQYESLIEQAWQRSDVLVLPEAALPQYLEQDYSWYQRLQQRALEANKTVLIGALSRDQQQRSYNSVVALGAPAELGERIYHKRILVPFGEYVPLPPTLRQLVRHLAPFSMAAGPDNQPPLPGPQGLFAVMLCYEIAFDAYSARQAAAANVLLTISNDAWFGKSLGPEQHAQIARMRAIENETYMLRATNTGLSFATDPNGAIIASAPQFQTAIAYGSYHPIADLNARTPFGRYGFWPIYLLLVVSAGVSALVLRKSSAANL